jgi:hypothetical protein
MGMVLPGRLGEDEVEVEVEVVRRGERTAT